MHRVYATALCDHSACRTVLTVSEMLNKVQMQRRRDLGL